MSIDSFRERVNLRIFSSKSNVLNLFKVFSMIVAFIAVGVLVHSIGFPQTEEGRRVNIFLLKFLFGFYILNYLVRFIYTFEPARFIRNTWLELAILLMIVLEALTELIFNAPVVNIILSQLDAESLISSYHLLLQLVLLTLLVIDLAKATTLLDLRKIDPGIMFMLSFLFLCLGGAILLMLPEMTTGEGGSDFLTALFSATSASCVTGLVTVDISTYFSLKGHWVLMVLMQMGGISILSFATFFASLHSRGISLKHHTMMPDYFSQVSSFDARSLLRQILLLSLLFETVGAILMYTMWDPSIKFDSFGSKMFFSIFHSISAFNNVGLTLFSDGMTSDQVRVSYLLHLLFATMIFMGALGFSSIQDIFSIRANKERLKLPWKSYRLSTKIALYSAVVLTIFGTLVFLLIENNNTLSGLNGVEKIITALFQTINRTSGFNTVDIGSLAHPTLIMMIFLMFIGASSGSTGGGIKTSTFTIIMVSAVATIRGKKNLEIFRYNIPWELLNRAFSIFIFSASFIFICVFFLSMLEPDMNIMALVFEAVSAFATTGYSMGITADLSPVSKYIIILSMFVGRIGTLTIAFALSKRVKTVAYKYPNAQFMVG